MRTRIGASAAPKTEELIERLHMLEHAQEVSDFDLKVVEREAAKLMRVEAVSAHGVLGAVYSFRGDTEKVEEHFGNALRLSGNSFDMTYNYALSLARVGMVKKAFLVLNADRWISGEGATEENLEIAMSYAMLAGHFMEGLNLSHRMKSEFPDHQVTMCGPGLIQRICDAIKKGVFGEEPAREVIRLAHEFRVEMRVRLSMTPAEVRFDADTRIFSHIINVMVSAQKAAEMNKNLAGRIVSRDDLMSNPGIDFVVLFSGKG